jgi:hypothetical protein
MVLIDLAVADVNPDITKTDIELVKRWSATGSVGFLGQGEVARGKRFAHISQSKNE